MGGFAQAAVLPASPDAPFYDVKLANTYGYSLTKFQQQLESASVEDMDHDGTLDLYVSSLGATAASADGIMVEVHNDPIHALCDGAQSLTPAQFAELSGKVMKVREAIAQ